METCFSKRDKERNIIVKKDRYQIMQVIMPISQNGALNIIWSKWNMMI